MRTILFLTLLLSLSCKTTTTMSIDKLPIVYSEDYNISFFGVQHLHPFDTQKYKKVVKHLDKTLNISKDQYHEPSVVSDKELLVVHSQAYLDKLENSETMAKVTEMGILSKLPAKVLKNKLLHPIKKATAGSILASELAIQHGWAINLSGGYHHAKREMGEGFCFFADVNLIIEHLRAKQLIKSALIVDLDAHQGNGHESIHGKDNAVYIYDAYNGNIYPLERDLKPYINYDFPLKHKTGDIEYLNLLKDNLPVAIAESEPDILIYVAGTDIYEHDPLGALSITKEGIIERDAFVFEQALAAKVPIVMLLSGGYHKDSGPIIGASIEGLLRDILE